MRRSWQMSKIVVGAVRRIASRASLAGAMLALMLQLFTSSMGFASDGAWIEICSDFGTEYVQVDLSDPTAPDQNNNCQDCVDCAICLASMTALIDNSQAQNNPLSATATAVHPVAQIIGGAVKRAWPETRGPPAATRKVDDCVQRAVMASIQENGGAL